MKEVWPSSLAFRFGGAPDIRAKATSMPSAEVPDMRPRTRSGFEFIAESFNTGKSENTAKRNGYVLISSAFSSRWRYYWTKRKIKRHEIFGRGIHEDASKRHNNTAAKPVFVNL